MRRVPDKTVATRKVGAEDIIMMRVPADRFRNNIPPHFDPPVDEKSQYQVALLAQVCKSYSFDTEETGRTDELHFWLQVASSNPGTTVRGIDVILPSMRWFALASATRNAYARSYLQTFGFNPMDLKKISFQEHGGSIAFPDGGRIEWSITGPGKRLPRVGVNHVLFVADDKPDATGHRVSALLSDTIMEQPGRIHIQTTALEPFLLGGERFSTVIHRMPKLEADVIWQQYSK